MNAQGKASRPQIQLLYFPGCPNYQGVRGALVGALKTLPPGVRAFEEVNVHAPDCPKALKNWPSPTVLVDGCDVFGDESGAGSACRILPAMEEQLERMIRSAIEDAFQPQAGGRHERSQERSGS